MLPLLTLLCFGVAIGLSPNRRRTILRSALGFALGMALLLIAFTGGRHVYLNVLPSSVNTAAAGAVYDQIGNTLRLALRTAFVLGLVIAFDRVASGTRRGRSCRSATACSTSHAGRDRRAARRPRSPRRSSATRTACDSLSSVAGPRRSGRTLRADTTRGHRDRRTRAARRDAHRVPGSSRDTDLRKVGPGVILASSS